MRNRMLVLCELLPQKSRQNSLKWEYAISICCRDAYLRTTHAKQRCYWSTMDCYCALNITMRKKTTDDEVKVWWSSDLEHKPTFCWMRQNSTYI